MTVRTRLVLGTVCLAALLGGAVAVLLGSRTPGCALPPPRPVLPAALRALGDFDQAYDSSDVANLEDAAVRAAGALHGDLIGASADAPVREAAASNTRPAAMVVPLRSPASGRADVSGLVVFLLDCQANAYFAAVEDDTTRQPPLTAFPPVGRAQAQAALGAGFVRLEYRTTPLLPEWVATTVPAASLAAR